MSEIKFSERIEGPYLIVTAETDLWALDCPERSGNIAMLEIPEVPGGCCNYEICIDAPAGRGRRLFSMFHSFRRIMARRGSFHVSFVEMWTLGLLIGEREKRVRRRNLAEREFLAGMLRLYAREPWLHPGLVARIRELGQNEIVIYDRPHVFPCGDNYMCANPRLLDKCEREPWMYRELRGYLQKPGWRER